MNYTGPDISHERGHELWQALIDLRLIEPSGRENHYLVSAAGLHLMMTKNLVMAVLVLRMFL